MIDRIFVSTGAFGKYDVDELLDIAYDNNITNIELSSGASFHQSMTPALIQARNNRTHRFLVHNYFPTPEKPFVLNLASEDNEVLELSRNHCKSAIELTSELGGEFYSVHAGFCFHAHPEDLGKHQRQLKRFSKKVANDIFLESLSYLSKIGKEKGVKIAVENNVATKDNLDGDRNDLYLGVTSEELLKFIDEISDTNVKLLIDTGHLKVSSNALNFDPIEFIDKLGNETIAFHISENDGIKDQNLLVSPEDWFWSSIKQFKNSAYFILEVYNIKIKTIQEQCRIISEGIYGK